MIGWNSWMPNSIWRESLSRSILDLVEDKANIGSWSWDFASGEISWSVGVYRIFGLLPSETPEMSLIGSLVQGSDAAVFRSPTPLIVARFLADRKFTIRRRDGELRTVHSHGKLLASGPSGTAQFVGAFLDISDSQLDDELFLLREALVDSMRQLFDVVIWQTDAGGALTDPMQWRMAIRRDEGSDSSAGVVQNVHPDDREGVHHAWAAAIASGKAYHSEFRMKLDGVYVPARSQAVPLLDSAGGILGWIGFTRQLDAKALDAQTTRIGDISPAQIRAARGMLNWTARDLAARAGVSFSSVRRAESEKNNSVSQATLEAIQAAFEKSGVSFVTSDTVGLGVIVKPQQ